MSTQLKIKGNWNELKGKLRAKYGELTDDDLAYAEGQEEQLIGRLQQKTGAAKEEIKKMIFSEDEKR
ncbi:MAG: CsbD family protein [Cyclobacterium sp.]|uniref:CsbD family protein n=1 Tax=unclassified Cyclobacterium TaxID=2615055 RepID=UPI0013D50D90|nr:CsbD family protein [Cyclobacterium sp. SYSU L10401]